MQKMNKFVLYILSIQGSIIKKDSLIFTACFVFMLTFLPCSSSNWNNFVITANMRVIRCIFYNSQLYNASLILIIILALLDILHCVQIMTRIITKNIHVSDLIYVPKFEWKRRCTYCTSETFLYVIPITSQKLLEILQKVARSLNQLLTFINTKSKIFY